MNLPGVATEQTRFESRKRSALQTLPAYRVWVQHVPIELDTMRLPVAGRRDEGPAMRGQPMRHPVVARYATDEARWQAVVARDHDADDAFFYAVRTTGVYCRPSCASRLANRENVRFFPTSRDAERAGFRPCKRCRPTAAGAAAQHADIVARACRLIEQSDSSPKVAHLAMAAGLSDSHFHRVFKSVTGVTPKAYATSHRARRLRMQLATSTTIAAAMQNAGYPSNSRLYAASKRMLGMTPSAFRAGGKGAVVRFAVGETWLGSILVAASDQGICSISLGDDPDALVRTLQDRLPRAVLIGGDPEFDQLVAKVIALVQRPAAGATLPLDVQGTAFQQRVWQALSKIPAGQTTTYTQLARRIGQPTAVRAVASACAANQLAIVIPCHRVVRSDGSLSGYRWGIERKAKLLHLERTGNQP